jgi:2-desacetyl-2-hydroxyethyl bacteriochlorophyllide A dehydrogenase
MLCIGAHAVRRAGLQAGETALVIGAGPIGLSVAQFAQLAGAEVMMMEVRAERLAFCESQLGITRLIDASADVLAQLRDYCGTELPQYVFDATGHPGSMQAAFEYVGHGGKLVLVGHYPGELSFSDPLFHGREMSLLASRNASQQDFDQVIDSLQSGQFSSQHWISHRATADDIADVFPAWLEPETGVIKAMLDLA